MFSVRLRKTWILLPLDQIQVVYVLFKYLIFLVCLFVCLCTYAKVGKNLKSHKIHVNKNAGMCLSSQADGHL